MSPSLFTELNDAELDALRQLFAAAALAANNPLATGDGLRLIATADSELERRRNLSLFAVATTPPVTPIDPALLATELSVAAADVRPEVTSTTKWSTVAALIGRAVRLQADDVYVTSVGGLSRNITVRLAQSRRGRDATVAAVVWTNGTEPIAQAIASTTRAVVEIPRLTLVFAVGDSDFDLAAIVLPASLPVPETLTLAYPSASLVRVDPQTA